MQIRREKDTYTLYKERTVIGTARLAEGAVWVEIDPAWQRRGYGSYLLKELLRENAGLEGQALANLLVEDAAGRGGSDDMTVLIADLHKAEKEE